MAAEILLVEDRESLRSMLAETLGREGYGVEAVATGDEAVRRDERLLRVERDAALAIDDVHRADLAAEGDDGDFNAQGGQGVGLQGLLEVFQARVQLGNRLAKWHLRQQFPAVWNVPLCLDRRINHRMVVLQ